MVSVSKHPKGCRIALRPIYLELKDYRTKRWIRPRHVKPWKVRFINMFSCRTRADALCKVMKKKLNVKDCRVRSYKV